MLDEFFSAQQNAMTLNERMRFCEAMRKLQQERKAKFPLGELVITPNAAATLDAIQALTFLVQHESGNWGEVCEEDRETNEHALKDGSRLFSVYEIEGENEGKTQFYVITEWNREATTILLVVIPHEGPRNRIEAPGGPRQLDPALVPKSALHHLLEKINNPARIILANRDRSHWINQTIPRIAE
jgi:hypothetical protein